MEHSLQNFCDKLYTEVIQSQKGIFFTIWSNCLQGKYENVFLSPVSLYSAMAMVLAGSEGETKHQMLSAMQLNQTLGRDALHNSIGTAVRTCLQSTPGVTLSVGNRLFAQHDAKIHPQYKAVIYRDYDADADNVRTCIARFHPIFFLIDRFYQNRSCA